jgi:hypothetical protein
MLMMFSPLDDALKAMASDTGLKINNNPLTTTKFHLPGEA